MLTILCEYLHNWFDEECPKHIGTITIADGSITVRNSDITLKVGQYFRIIGSVFNDGVHQFPAELTDEEFEGALWELKIPKEVVMLAEDIAAWQDKYGGINSPAMSPYNSESFAGYSYSKSTGVASANSNDSANGWQNAFRSRLNLWRKL